MQVQGDHIRFEGDNMIATYAYKHTNVAFDAASRKYVCSPVETQYTFKTDTKVPRLGIMLVGLGGNNGTTFTGGVLANKHKITWMTRRGQQSSNFYGSITQSSTTKIGVTGASEVYLPLCDILPLVRPEDTVIHGWDISKLNLADSMARAQVLDYNLQEQLRPLMRDIVPLPSIYYPDFIAANQSDRADNVIAGNDKWAHLEQIRKDIRDFKAKNGVDKVIVLWTANTERFCELTRGVHDTPDNLLAAIRSSHPEISPSTIFATAAILEGSSYINGSPQNTLVPGVIELAKQRHVFVVGDDFKTGQTKFKTSMTDFLVSAGIRPDSIVSYNHLGNNDGKNLSSERQFRSKELSKKSCVDDILQSNRVLYPDSTKIDHEIIIKYVPNAGDSKKAIDEYSSSIFMNGQHTLVVYNVCEDSLLAAPIILDLILLTEIFERIEYRDSQNAAFRRFNSVLSTLGYLCKAPLTDVDTPLVNSLFRQKEALNNIFKACAGLHCDDNLLLEFRCPVSEQTATQQQAAAPSADFAATQTPAKTDFAAGNTDASRRRVRVED